MTDEEQLNVLAVRSRLARWNPVVIAGWKAWCTSIVNANQRRIRIGVWEQRLKAGPPAKFVPSAGEFASTKRK